jgi:hypothetical protein
MECIGCGIIGADARPNWAERSARRSMTGTLMAKRPTTELIAEGLSLPERVLLFCLTTDTDWQWARRHAGDRATDDDPRPDRSPTWRRGLRAD